MADESDRREISRLRHAVYACELEQYPANTQGELSDRLDQSNEMLIVRVEDQLAGFVSITPPTASSFSIDKYFRRTELPFAVHEQMYEVRLLTVVPKFRLQPVAAWLLYAALRWVEAHQGTQVVAIGREQVLKMYLSIGMRPQPCHATCGKVTYQLLLGDVPHLRQQTIRYPGLLRRLRTQVTWNFPFTADPEKTCFHGGAFFQQVGERFDDLSRADTVINADVLDAWYPPAPEVVEALQQRLPWLMRTSPPTRCSGLVEEIACARGVCTSSILPGAGSSDLIFRALRQWLTPASRVLMLEPMYSEYAYVLESVIGCPAMRLSLTSSDDFQVPLHELAVRTSAGVDLVILVNPNSPTGQLIPRSQLLQYLENVPATTIVWVDETYIEYGGQDQSVEQFAARSANVVVCKSMSKIYALSGMRVAYLCGSPGLLDELRPLTPPWIVGLPAQLAAVESLKHADYYEQRISETHSLRYDLALGLRTAGWHVVSGVANFLLCRIPDHGPSTAELLRACRSEGLFLRDPGLEATLCPSRWIRIAVKDARTNARMLQILADALSR